MIVADLLSIILVVAIPIWVTHRIFTNNPDRPRAASWALAVIGGPFVYSLLGLVIFALSKTNAGGLFDVFLAGLVSLVSASIYAVFVRPKRPGAPIASSRETT
jgi:hypothetical protein